MYRTYEQVQTILSFSLALLSSSAYAPVKYNMKALLGLFYQYFPWDPRPSLPPTERPTDPSQEGEKRRGLLHT